jgi:hypothetical protein
MSYYPSSAYVVKPRSHSTERNQSAAYYYHPQPVYVTSTAPQYVAPSAYVAPASTYVAPASAYMAPAPTYVAPASAMTTPVAIHSPTVAQPFFVQQQPVVAPQYTYPYQYGAMQYVVAQPSQPSYQAFNKNANPNYQNY